MEGLRYGRRQGNFETPSKERIVGRSFWPCQNDRVPRFKLTIEYAGTRYSGWQIQKNASTIQGEIDRAVRVVTGRKDFELYGSGRTDAGVHALAQVAHLDVSSNLPPDSLRQRLNDELPADINILAAAPVPHRFHARHHAVAAPLPVPDRPAPHGIRQALRLVGQGSD